MRHNKEEQRKINKMNLNMNLTNDDSRKSHKFNLGIIPNCKRQDRII